MNPLLNKRMSSQKLSNNNRNSLNSTFNQLGQFGQLNSFNHLSQLNGNNQLNGNTRKANPLVGSTLLQPQLQQQQHLLTSFDQRNCSPQVNNQRSISRKWEQKHVQVKTLEGEFSVTVWAAGAEDGMCLNCFIRYIFPIELIKICQFVFPLFRRLPGTFPIRWWQSDLVFVATFTTPNGHQWLHRRHEKDT